MEDSDKLLSLLDERPKFHGDSGNPVCWGVSRDLSNFIFHSVSPEDTSLETGSGISTLVFALRRSFHTTITPNKKEVEAISEYARRHSICLDRVSFVNDNSENYLPKSANGGPLDFVLIDGRHAFPSPAIDYFYTAPKVRKGGIVVVDDVKIPSVKMLVDFMTSDENWKLTKEFRRSLAFTKVSDQLDVEWDSQRYNREYLKSITSRGIVRRAVRKSRRVMENLLGESD